MLFAAANLSFLFTDLPFLQRFSAARAAGFSAVEYLFPYDYPVADIRQELSDNALKQVLFNVSPGDWEAGDRGLACLPDRSDEFRDTIAQAQAYARGLNCPRLHCMAGLCPDLSDARYYQTYLDNLAFAAESLAADGIELMIEAINREDMPGYFLADIDEAAKVVQTLREAGHVNVSLQFDFYHCARIHGEATERVAQYAGLIGHFQIAGRHGRHEPDGASGEYKQALNEAAMRAPGRFVGFEYKPAGDAVRGLDWMRSYAASLSF